MPAAERPARQFRWQFSQRFKPLDAVSLWNYHRARVLELPHQDQIWTSPVEVIVLFERVRTCRLVERAAMGIELVFERWPHGMNRQQHAPVIT